MLLLRNLQKSYGGLRVTNNVSLSVAEGELLALIGPNGAGKTSLLAQIMGEVAPDQGEVWLADANMTELSAAARCRNGIARTYQITSLLHSFSALDNVRFAVQAHEGHSFRFFKNARRDSHSSERAHNLLQRVGLNERAFVRASDLAHGEQRQLEIAMALAGRPRVILLDEPTAGMGSDDSRRITNLIASLKGTMGIVLVEHDMPMVFSVADRIAVLINGRIVADDSAVEIAKNEEVRVGYLGDGDA